MTPYPQPSHPSTCSTDVVERPVKLAVVFMNLRWMSEGEAHSLKLQVHVSEHSTSHDTRATEQATTATVTCSSGAESNCTAVQKSEDTPPAIHLMSKDVTSFTRPYPTLVLLAINTGARRPGYKAGCLSQDMCILEQSNVNKPRQVWWL